MEAFSAILAASPIAGLAYARDALRHRLTRDGVDPEAAARVLERLTAHEREEWIDVGSIIRRIRTTEAEGLRDAG